VAKIKPWELNIHEKVKKVKPIKNIREKICVLLLATISPITTLAHITSGADWWDVGFRVWGGGSLSSKVGKNERLGTEFFQLTLHQHL
jgi:hypothetical protein